MISVNIVVFFVFYKNLLCPSSVNFIVFLQDVFARRRWSKNCLLIFKVKNKLFRYFFDSSFKIVSWNNLFWKAKKSFFSWIESNIQQITMIWLPEESWIYK